MDVVFLILVWFSIAVTVASLVPLNDWWIRAFDFPRLQICVLGLFAFVGFLFFWEPTSLLDTLSLVGLGLCLAFQGSKIYPYLPIASKQVLGASAHGDEASLFLLVANVRMENRQAQQLLQIVRDADPDILLIVETDAWWEQQLRGLEDDYGYIVKQVQDNFYGMILYSRPGWLTKLSLTNQ